VLIRGGKNFRFLHTLTPNPQPSLPFGVNIPAMPAAPQRRFAHLTLLELVLGFTALAVAGFFLVRGMQQAKERTQREQLVHAMKLNDERTIKALLLANPQLCNVRGNHGYTPLHWAASQKNVEIAQWLLDNNAVFDAKNESGQTPLHLACSYGSPRIAQLLLTKGADLEAKDSKGWTSLYGAVNSGYVGVTELLLASGANTTATTQDGWTPLTSAEYHGRKTLIKLLRAHGAKE
jgi:ankyrin repeat protein